MVKEEKRAPETRSGPLPPHNHFRFGEGQGDSAQGNHAPLMITTGPKLHLEYADFMLRIMLLYKFSFFFLVSSVFKSFCRGVVG